MKVNHDSTTERDRVGRPTRLAYLSGDYAAGSLTAIATAAGVHAVIAPGWDMVMAMLAGAAIGTAAHLVAMALCGPLLGMWQVMAPGSMIGMYGGMLFGMRDSMQPAGWGQVLLVGALFGIGAVGAVQIYDRVLRGPRAGAVE